MIPWKRMLALLPVAGALTVSPATAQDDDWTGDEDDPLIVLDEQLDGLSDQLDNLEGLMAFDFEPQMRWLEGPCKDKAECEVKVIVKDGERMMIVNDDTMKVDSFPMPHPGTFAFEFGPGMDHHRHRPKFKFDHDFHGRMYRFGDPELRKLEREARTIARKARGAEGSERTKLEEELDGKLNEIFDHKLELQKKAIEKAEERISTLKERESKRKSARKEIIKNRKDELLGMDRYLEW